MLKRTTIIGRSILLFATCIVATCVQADQDVISDPPANGVEDYALPKFHCELEKVKANSDSTTRDRQIRRMKRVYKKCIGAYKAGLATEQQELRKVLATTAEPSAHRYLSARIDLIQKVIDTEYKLTKVLGSGENSMDVRDLYDSAHGS